jgi:phage terminase small subunit
MGAAKIKRGLTLRQAKFAPEFVATNGNATEAAKRAGYSGSWAHVAGHEALKMPKVVAEIVRLTRKHEITSDRVLTRLDNLSTKAEEAGQIAAAVKAEELLGKSLGMWVERSMSVHVDMSAAHLEALRALSRRRSGSDGEGSGNAA